MTNPPRFDLLLVYNTFRRHDQYLTLCRRLGRELRIGILNLNLNVSSVKKTAKTDQRFLQACFDAGAVAVTGEAETKVLLLPRMGLGSIENTYQRVHNRIRYQRLAILVCGPFSGVPHLQTLVDRFGSGVIMAQELSRFAQFEPETLPLIESTGCHLVEVGSPYRRYPCFPEFQTDFLAAYPSTVSVGEVALLYRLLRRFILAIDSLPTGSVIYTKVHNVKDEGNYLSNAGRWNDIRLTLPMIKGLLNVLDRVLNWKFAGRALSTWMHPGVLGTLNRMQNAYIFRRTHNLTDEFPGFGVEHYISGVRRGVLTGLSTTIWETLYQRVPIWIMDDDPVEQRPATYQILHESYGISGWRRPETDRAFARISESCRQTDLVDFLLRLIQESPVAAPVQNG